MTLLNIHNHVYMQEYGNGGTGGGSGGSGGSQDFNLPDSGSLAFDFEPIESNYKFTDPPRYYKANDPYYWEVDNLPLKEIQENCLWLKDQIIGVRSVSGIGRDKFTDLQPYSTGSDRMVFVRPGNYTARINDATQAGIADRAGGSAASVADSVIKTTNSFNIPDSVFKTLVGSLSEARLYNTGLFDQVQHHSAYSLASPVLDWLSGSYFSLNNPPITEAQGPSNLPKVKLAIWRQINGNADAFPGFVPDDLQQLAVSFTRRWGGVVRTAVVSVPEPLSIQIPEFKEEDFLISPYENATPEVRMDLVFVYTHPIDKSNSTIANSRTGGMETITAPRLGVVKGAGAILSKEGDPLALDIISNPDLLNDPSWANQATTNRYYNEAVPDADSDAAIHATMADNAISQDYTPFPGKRVSSNFPSPDDLLNLAPLLADELSSESLSLVGQTVLPICYVSVRKGATIIREEDIIDIRPFFRTTELAYNERAGVAAANPPLSFANPAVGQAQLDNSINVFKDYFVGGLLAQIEDIIEQIQEGSIHAQPTAVAVCSDNAGANGSQNGTTGILPFGDWNYAFNREYELWEAGVKLIQETGNADPTTTVNAIYLGPGTYELTFNSFVMYTDPNNAMQTVYSLALHENGVPIYPNNTFAYSTASHPNGTIATVVAGDAGGHSDKEWTGSLHMKALINNTRTDEYNKYELVWNSTNVGSGAQRTGASFWGTLGVTRLANIDGSLTPPTMDEGDAGGGDEEG